MALNFENFNKKLSGAEFELPRLEKIHDRLLQFKELSAGKSADPKSKEAVMERTESTSSLTSCFEKNLNLNTNSKRSLGLEDMRTKKIKSDFKTTKDLNFEHIKLFEPKNKDRDGSYGKKETLADLLRKTPKTKKGQKSEKTNKNKAFRDLDRKGTCFDDLSGCDSDLGNCFGDMASQESTRETDSQIVAANRTAYERYMKLENANGSKTEELSFKNHNFCPLDAQNCSSPPSPALSTEAQNPPSNLNPEDSKLQAKATDSSDSAENADWLSLIRENFEKKNKKKIIFPKCKSNLTEAQGNTSKDVLKVDGKKNSMVTEAQRRQRTKQIRFGKNTESYKKYREINPKRRGYEKTLLSTPDVDLEVSKRRWYGMLRVWRKNLHRFNELFEEKK